MLRVKDVMQKFNVCKTTVYKWINQGLPIVKSGKITFIEEEELIKFLKRGE